MISLNELISRLSSDVPEMDSIPSPEQYQRCVLAAVADYGRRAGRLKIATLSIIANTATYDLPSDFVKAIRMDSLLYPGEGIQLTGAGIVPLASGYKERYTVANGQITFYPTPTYTTERALHYQAGWTLDSNGAYDELEEEHAEALLLLATSQALEMQANYFARQAWQYTIGDERVSKERLASELRAQAQENQRRYTERLTSQSGPYGARSEYPSSAYS